MAKILYNGVDPFDGISTVPIVSRTSSQIYQNAINGLTSTFTLEGKIRISNLCARIESNEFANQLDAYFYARRSIINSFSENFKELQVLDKNDNVVYSGQHCLIRSINFDDSNYFSLIPYTITIDVFTGKFAEYGILDPSEEWTFEDNDNCSGTMVHRVSCASFNTTDQAIENAKNFIESRSGTSGVIHPYFNSYQSPILRSKQISVNRLTGELSLEETYLFDPSSAYLITTVPEDIPIETEDGFELSIEDVFNSSGFLTYITEVRESGKNVDVAISGSIIGGINSEINDLRALFYGIDWHSVANENYDYGSGLMTQPLEFSTREDVSRKEITFSLVYSNNKYSGPYLIDSTTIIENRQDNSYCVKFRGFIKSDTGCKGQRFEDVKNYYNSLNIESIVAEKFAKFGNTSIKLNTKPKSKSYSESLFESSITFEVVYCKVKGEGCGCLDSLDYKLNFKPAIPIYTANPSINGEGCYYVQDLGYNRRALFSISGTAILSNCCTFEKGKQDLRVKLNELNTKYFVATEKILDSLNFVESSVGKTIAFDVSWSGIQSCPLSESLRVCS